ncbi:MAG: hypothetical protein AAGF20_07095 [Pseudomonadota bacterium]
MGLIWWVLPALAGVIGLMLSFAGLGRLMKLKLAAGGLRFAFGVGFLGLAGLVTFAGLNLQTYKRLTYERVVATVSFDKTAGVDDTYTATLVLSEGDVRTIPDIKGDEFSLGAQVITFKPMAQMLGYDSVYRLDYIEGRYARRYNAVSVSEATSTGIALSANPGLDVHALAKAQGKRFGIAAAQRDASFGSAVYAPMGDTLKYEVSLTQTALILRPANPAAETALRTQGQTGE